MRRGGDGRRLRWPRRRGGGGGRGRFPAAHAEEERGGAASRSRWVPGEGGGRPGREHRAGSSCQPGLRLRVVASRHGRRHQPHPPPAATAASLSPAGYRGAAGKNRNPSGGGEGRGGGALLGDEGRGGPEGPPPGEKSVCGGRRTQVPSVPAG